MTTDPCHHQRAKMSLFLSLLALLLLSQCVPEGSCREWPVPYVRHKSRPPSSTYCKALYPFCPTGYNDSHIPEMASDDTIEVFILKAPVWEFKFGDFLGKFNIMHDAIGFRSVKTGLNYTTEWYELFQLFNCTFPHVMEGRSSPLWCNQGAACLYPGIDDKHWKANGTVTKVTELTGSQFNQLADYIQWDNHTGLYYETWRVHNSTGPNSTVWFNPYDCANYVIRMFEYMGRALKVNFTKEYKANYTFISLISDMPQFLGNESDIFGQNGNATLAAAIMDFYSSFQAHQSMLHFLESLVRAFDDVFVKKEFYLYYNSAYWLLPMKEPYMKLTYEYVPYVQP